LCAETLQGVTEVEETFQGFREKSSGGKVPLCTRAIAARSAEVEESFEDSKRIKLKRESAFMHRALQEIVEAERRPFGGFEFEEAQEGKHFQERRQKLKYRLRSREKRLRPLIS
jgi:hypothetical protein